MTPISARALNCIESLLRRISEAGGWTSVCGPSSGGGGRGGDGFVLIVAF